MGAFLNFSYLWFHSLFLFLCQEYEKALKYVRILLKNEPGNKQAIELEKLINQALKKGMSVCVRTCVCVGERAWERASVWALGHACVRERVHVCVSVCGGLNLCGTKHCNKDCHTSGEFGYCGVLSGPHIFNK